MQLRDLVRPILWEEHHFAWPELQPRSGTIHNALCGKMSESDYPHFVSENCHMRDDGPPRCEARFSILEALRDQCRLAGGVDFHGLEESSHFEDLSHGGRKGREGTGAASGFHPLHRREEHPQASTACEGETGTIQNDAAGVGRYNSIEMAFKDTDREGVKVALHRQSDGCAGI
jgi:hypothetical protein